MRLVFLISAFLTYGAIAITMQSCSKEEVTVEGDSVVRMSVVAGPAVKTSIGSDGKVYWSDGTTIKVLETASGSTSTYTSETGTTEDMGSTMVFPVTLAAKTAPSFSYTAFTPVSSLYGDVAEPNCVALQIPCSQSPGRLTFDPWADILIAQKQESDTQPSELTMRFARPVAIGKITLTGMPVPEEISSISFSAVKSGKPVVLAGATSFDLDTADPIGEYGGVLPFNQVVLDCGGIPEGMYSAFEPYTTVDFDWKSEEYISASEDVGSAGIEEGYLFTCWPFELAEGDTFTIVARAGAKTCTRTVTIPSGRSFFFEAGDLSSFSVNMAASVVEVEPEDDYTRYRDGLNIEIGGKSFNKADFGEPVLLSGTATISAGGAYFIEDDASVTINCGGTYDGNILIVGRTAGSRPSLTLSGSSPVYLKQTSSDCSAAFKNLTLSSRTVQIFSLAYDNASLGTFALDDCRINAGGILSFAKTGQAIGDFVVKDCDISLCKEDFGSSNRDNYITRAYQKSVSFSRFIFRNNTVWPKNGNPSLLGFNNDTSTDYACTVGEVQFCDNLFVDVLPYGGAFADWSSDYTLTLTGNMIDLQGNRTMALSGSSSYYPSENCFARRTGGDNLTDVTCEGNIVYDSDPRQYATLAVQDAKTAGNPARYHVSVASESILSSRDYVNGVFPIKNGPLCAEATGTSGRKYYANVDYDNKVINIHHAPGSGSLASIKVFGPPGTEPVVLSSGAASVSFGGSDWTIAYPDAVTDSAPSGYTLVWADEFNLSDLDHQAWRRVPTYSNYYQDPADPELVSVSGGCLNLGTKTTTDGTKGFRVNSGDTYGFVSGGVHTKSLTSFNMGRSLSGRIDVRLKFNYRQGFWEAAWMLADPDTGGGNEPGGEIDIMEHLNTASQSASRKVYQTLHSQFTVTQKNNGATPDQIGHTEFTSSNLFNDSWHVYSAEVTGGTVNFYFDGVKQSAWYLNGSRTYNSIYTESYWTSRYGSNDASNLYYYFPFNHWDYYMILTAQVGGAWNGNPSGSTAVPLGAKTYQVDYVRYYTK